MSEIKAKNARFHALIEICSPEIHQGLVQEAMDKDRDRPQCPKRYSL